MLLRISFGLCFLLSLSLGLDLESQLKQAFLYQEQERYVEAIAIYRNYLNVKPQAYSIANRLGFCFEKISYSEIAKKYYRQALAYSPNNAYAKAALKRLIQKSYEEELSQTEKVTIELSNSDQKTSAEPLILKRLWFILDYQIYTMYSDGRDLKKLANTYVNKITNVKRDLGFFAEKIISDPEADLNRDIYFFNINTGELKPLLNSALDEYNASLYENNIYFLKGLKPNLYKIGFSEEKLDLTSEKLVFQGFDSIFAYQFFNDNLFFTASKESLEPKRLYLKEKHKEASILAQSFDSYEDFILSENGNYLAIIRSDSNNKKNFLIYDSTKKTRIPVFNEGVLELSGVFNQKGNKFYYSKSQYSLKDNYITELNEFDIDTQEIRLLWKHNFLNKNLILDDNWLYFITNYDNNFEIYRLNLDSLKRERLTMSSGNETQFGFWPFSFW